MILQVFGQRFSCERIGQWMFWKTLKNFKYISHIYRPLVAFQKTCEELWLFRVIFKNSSLVIDYRCVVIDYTVILRSYNSSVWISKLFVTGNWLHNSCNRLHILKFKFKSFWNLFKKLFLLLERKTYFSKWST